MQKKDQKIRLIKNAIDALSENRSDCHLCPRMCRTNRDKGEIGFCGVGNHALVAHYCLHFGEEPCLSGYYDYKKNLQTKSSLSGSGTVFFSGCNLKCIYCQNYQISWQIYGTHVSPDKLASIFMVLQEKRALNINLVTPTHLILPILESLKKAFALGLNIPIIYNTSAYDSYETIVHLDGIIDIYMPDFKYFRNDSARRFSHAWDYPDKATTAIKEMYRQVGNLEMDNEGNAKRGLIIRHLILPGHMEESCTILEWIAANISTNVYLSLMSQYYPCNNVPDEINRKISNNEYDGVLAKAEELGFENVYIQTHEITSKKHFVPDFSKDNPFSWEEN
ncbi:MAG: radical SAM protein [Deltaproteobacteria bacterium]|nr:radical SAM protein [Deltaproteobacteria bacterium]